MSYILGIDSTLIERINIGKNFQGKQILILEGRGIINGFLKTGNNINEAFYEIKGTPIGNFKRVSIRIENKGILNSSLWFFYSSKDRNIKIFEIEIENTDYESNIGLMKNSEEEIEIVNNANDNIF